MTRQAASEEKKKKIVQKKLPEAFATYVNEGLRFLKDI